MTHEKLELVDEKSDVRLGGRVVHLGGRGETVSVFDVRYLAVEFGLIH